MQTIEKCKQNGFALVAMVTIMVTILVIGMVGMLKWSSGGYRGAVNRTQRTRMLYAAESGLQYTLATIKSDRKPVNQAQCDKISNAFVAVASSLLPADIVLAKFEIIPLNVRTCQVSVACASLSDMNNCVEITQLISGQFFSLLDYGIFYNSDMEIHSTRTFQFLGGPVHANGNIYVGCDGHDFYFDSTITASGDILHEGSSGGDIYIKNGSDVNVSMKQGGTWVDSTYNKSGVVWREKSLELWDGNVLTKDHGITDIEIPFPGASSDNPHKVIEMPAETDTAEDKEVKYCYKATLSIIDDEVFIGTPTVDGNLQNQKIGNVDDMDWIETDSTFYNEREKYDVTPVTIDLAGMQEWLAEGTHAHAFINDPDYAGILYVKQEDVQGRAVRLKNGETLPVALANGLTVVTPNPLYVQGNFNTSNKKPSCLVSDSLTILSPNWNDDHDNGKDKADDCTIYAAIITGDVPSTEADDGKGNDKNASKKSLTSAYGGGVENLPRLLEQWQNNQGVLTIYGSLIRLWESRQETAPLGSSGDYKYYFNPPSFYNWSYDPDLSNMLPPGTPVLRNCTALAWKRTR